MKFTIDASLDDELVDKIFLEKLKEDYIMLCEEIWRIKSTHEGKTSHEYPSHIREDYESNYDRVIAMENLFSYYMLQEDAKKLIQKGTDIRYGNQTA